LVKSVRLGEAVERDLKAAAKRLGVTESEFVRGAVVARCREVLGDSLAERLQDVIGAINSQGGRAAATHRVYSELLAAEQRSGSDDPD
jgi:predicted DNA-binding protein